MASKSITVSQFKFIAMLITRDDLSGRSLSYQAEGSKFKFHPASNGFLCVAFSRNVPMSHFSWSVFLT